MAEERKYRKLPVVISAVQWFENGDHPEDFVKVREGSGEETEGKLVRYFRRADSADGDTCTDCGNLYLDHGWIDTLEAGHRVCPGDWIIRGIEGEFYPCKPGIFAATYELAEATPQ